MPLTRETKEGIISEHGTHEGDTGSPEVQVALLTERITGRWTHKASGRSYHMKYNPPKAAGVDDVRTSLISTLSPS